MMAGVMLVILGLTGMGTAVKYLPRPVVVGFTNGIAVLIASTQIKDLLGLRIAEMPAEFAARIAVLPRTSTRWSGRRGFGVAPRSAADPAATRCRASPGTIVALIGRHGVVAGMSAWTSRRSARASAGFPAGCRTSRDSPRFQLELVSTCCRRRSRWRCSARSSR